MGSVVGKCAKEKDWEKRKPWIENKPPAYRQKQWTHATSLDMKKRPSQAVATLRYARCQDIILENWAMKLHED